MPIESMKIGQSLELCKFFAALVFVHTRYQNMKFHAIVRLLQFWASVVRPVSVLWTDN